MDSVVVDAAADLASVVRLMTGATLLAANGFIFIAGTLAVVFLAARTPIEEAKLTERFGDAFRDYMQTTPRFVPRPPGLWWRALAAFLVLPGTIAFLVPLTLLGPATPDRFTELA